MGQEELRLPAQDSDQTSDQVSCPLSSAPEVEKDPYPQEAASFPEEEKFAHQRMVNGSSLRFKAEARVQWLELRRSEERISGTRASKALSLRSGVIV